MNSSSTNAPTNPARPYIYNSKIIQHYVKQEWTMTNSNLQVQADLPLDVAPQADNDEGNAAPQEAWDMRRCVVLSGCSKVSRSLKDTGTLIEKAMDEILTRIAKLHSGSSKLQKPYNLQPNDSQKKPLMCMTVVVVRMYPSQRAHSMHLTGMQPSLIAMLKTWRNATTA